MKKFFGSVAHVVSILSFIVGAGFLFLAYQASIPCEGLCTAEYIDWKPLLLYGILCIVGSIILYFVGNHLKK